jgi:hypothetical protein
MHQDLFIDESDEERAPEEVTMAPWERHAGPGLPPQGTSDDVATARRKSRPFGVRQARKSAIAARHRTQLDFMKAIPSLSSPPDNSGKAEPPRCRSSRAIILMASRRGTSRTGLARTSFGERSRTFRVWWGGKWREIQRVVIDPSDPFGGQKIRHKAADSRALWACARSLGIERS